MVEKREMEMNDIKKNRKRQTGTMNIFDYTIFYEKMNILFGNIVKENL